MKKFTICCFIIITSIFSSCGVTDTEEKLQPGRRDYVWNIDTLQNSDMAFNSIWGVNPGDVYIVSHSMNNSCEKLYHFDGQKWTTFRITALKWTPFCVVGTSNNNIFFGDLFGIIYKYDGKVLSVDYQTSDNNNYSTFIINMCRGENMDVFALSYTEISNDSINNEILKYDGEKWGVFFSKNAEYCFIKALYLENKLYLLAESAIDNCMILFELQNGKLKRIKQTNLSESVINISIIDGKLYAITKGLLERYTGKLFLPILGFNKESAYYAFGKNEKDIFLMGYMGLYHYNGNNIEQLVELNPFDFMLMSDPLVFEDELFVYGRSRVNSGQNIVIHGKINMEEN